MILTLEPLMVRLADELALCNGPVDVGDFVRSFYPHDVEAGELLTRAFDARLLDGVLVSRLVKFHGHINGFADDTRPVWH